MNIENKMIRCQLNSNLTFIICFYYSITNEKKIFATTIFRIKDMNLIKEKDAIISFDRELIEINQIKTAISKNEHIFICILNNWAPACFINYNSFYEFEKISCQKLSSGWSSEYKVLYFDKTEDFMFLSRTNLVTTILDNIDNSIKSCDNTRYFKVGRQENMYSFIYINDYQLVNYTSFPNCKICKNISILSNIKQSEYIEEIKHSIKNSQNKGELL